MTGENGRITKSISEAFSGNPQTGELERVYPVPEDGVRKIIKTTVDTAINATNAISFLASSIVQHVRTLLSSITLRETGHARKTLEVNTANARSQVHAIVIRVCHTNTVEELFSFNRALSEQRFARRSCTFLGYPPCRFEYGGVKTIGRIP